jgi:hypothetical protein
MATDLQREQASCLANWVNRFKVGLVKKGKNGGGAVFPLFSIIDFDLLH